MRESFHTERERESRTSYTRGELDSRGYWFRALENFGARLGYPGRAHTHRTSFIFPTLLLSLSLSHFLDLYLCICLLPPRVDVFSLFLPPPRNQMPSRYETSRVIHRRLIFRDHVTPTSNKRHCSVYSLRLSSRVARFSATLTFPTFARPRFAPAQPTIYNLQLCRTIYNFRLSAVAFVLFDDSVDQLPALVVNSLARFLQFELHNA